MTAYKWLPSEPTDEMLDAAMSSLPLSMPEIQVKQIYSLLWKAAPEVEQDPVAIVRRYRDGTVVAEIRDKSMEEGVKLYTHPQPSWKQESVKLTAVDDLMTRVSSTSPVLRLPDEVMSSEALFEFITNNPQLKCEPLSEGDISKLIYWVHRLYAEIPDKKENYELFDEVNASGVLMIDHFYDRLPKESEYNETTITNNPRP
jgi:hypothetical protein